MDQHTPAIPDVGELRTRIGAAATPALLMMVAHVTDDPSVLREEWRPNSAQLPNGGLEGAVEAEVRDYCLSRLEPMLQNAAEWPSAPSERVLSAIGEWSLGVQASAVGDLLQEAFVAEGTDPRAPDWSLAEIDPARTLRVGIIGSGISGLLAGLRMKQAGIPFTIYEKSTSIGGTWAENTYPGCRTDVHSHIYSYSFFPWDWSSYFGRQEVILDYLYAFADRNGLLEAVQFNTEVAGATWDEARNLWSVRTVRDGAESEVDVEVLISAVGQLNRPAKPPIEGLERFRGPAFHSAEWDHDVDLTGTRVAVVGTGASALQFAPATAPVAAQMTIFQRSPPWLIPTPELRQDIGDDERWLFNWLPFYRSYYRLSIFLPRAIGQLAAATVDPDYPPTEHAVSAANEDLRTKLTSYLVEQVGSDEELLAQVVPDYPPGAKRIVRDDGTWISTLKRDNVRLVSDRIERVDETGIWTEAGEHVEVDVVLFGTGFNASDFLTPMTVTGLGGKDLHETWGVDACAYMGITVPEFPNLFCMYGPNTNLVLHGNLVFFMECQAAYVLSALRVLLETGNSAMSLRKEVMDDYQEEVTRASALRAWGWSGTHTWYQNAEGRSTIMWPLSARRYLEGTRAASPDHYDFFLTTGADSTSATDPTPRGLQVTEETLTVNDMRTRYLTGGPDDSPTVVFLHDGAWGASADVTWGDVLASAAQEFRVIAPDMLGFGDSAKVVRLDESPFAFRIRHVFALLDQLGIDKPVHLVGNSFGGSLALRALTDAAVAPRIASVATISGTGGPWRTEASAELGPFDGTEADISRIVGLLCDDFPSVQEQVRARYECARKPGHYAGVMAVHQSVPEPLQVPRAADPYPASLQGVRTPVLLTECLRDPLVESGWTGHIREVLPQARVVELEHKHAPNISHPQEIWKVLRDFIAETASARDDGVQLVAD